MPQRGKAGMGATKLQEKPLPPVGEGWEGGTQTAGKAPLILMLLVRKMSYGINKTKKPSLLIRRKGFLNIKPEVIASIKTKLKNQLSLFYLDLLCQLYLQA